MNCKELGEKIGLDEDEYRELFELFLDTGRADYKRLKLAFAAGDAQQVARSAHTINGAAGNMGIMNIHEVAKRIELAAVEKQLNDAAGDVEALNGLFGEVAQLVGS